MFDPVFGNIPFVKNGKVSFLRIPTFLQEIDYLLVSHDHFDHLDKQSIARLLKNNPQMKLFCGLGTGELIQSWFSEMKIVEAGWYQQIEDEGLKITFPSGTTLEQTFRTRWRSATVGSFYAAR